MKRIASILILALLGCAASAQAPDVSPKIPIQVRSLFIDSPELPMRARLDIIHSMVGKSYPLGEIGTHVLQAVRDDGFAAATVTSVQLSKVMKTGNSESADVFIQLHTGALFHLQKIGFDHASVFPIEKLRAQFAIQDGALFNATAIGKGLDNLKNLYAGKGYTSFGAIPKLKYDDAQHTVVLTIDLNEGPKSGSGK